MKYLPHLLGFVILVLIGSIFVGSSELRDLVRLKQSEIEGLKKELETCQK